MKTPTKTPEQQIEEGRQSAWEDFADGSLQRGSDDTTALDIEEHIEAFRDPETNFQEGYLKGLEEIKTDLKAGKIK